MVFGLNTDAAVLLNFCPVPLATSLSPKFRSETVSLSDLNRGGLALHVAATLSVSTALQRQIKCVRDKLELVRLCDPAHRHSHTRSFF